MSEALDAIRRLNKKAFLKAFSEMGVIQHAADEAGIVRQTHYEWLKNDPEYVEAFAAAEEAAIDRLEAEATRRAIIGVEEPVGWYKGEAGGTVTRYSDVLLMFMLKARRPTRFKDKFSAPDGTTPDEFAANAIEATQRMQAATLGDNGSD